jgi:hypothetical protein
MINKNWKNNATFAGGFGNNRLIQNINDREIYLSSISSAMSLFKKGQIMMSMVAITIVYLIN